MNVRCPNCQTLFRVDPERIPVAGIKARCSRCSNTFELTRGVQAGAAVAAPASTATPAMAPTRPVLTPASAPMPAVAPVPAPSPAQAAAAAPSATTFPRPLPPAPAPMAPKAVPAAEPSAPAPAAVLPSTPKRPSFRNQDPGARAQRLARALVSDIVAYNKDKLKQSTGAAALRSEFRDEIRKSWEEYVEQVGLDMAKGSPYFRDALNEILAKGERVF